MGIISVMIGVGATLLASELVGEIVIKISDIITKSRLRSVLTQKSLGNALLKSVDRCTNIVTLEEIESGKSIMVKGTDIDSNISEDDIIYV